jgi:hypothetical protein
VAVPALAGLEPAVAGRVHEAGLVIVRRAGAPVLGEIAGGYRPAGDVQPPPLPLLRRLGWLLGGQQTVPAERAQSGLSGQQARWTIFVLSSLKARPRGASHPASRALTCPACPAVAEHDHVIGLCGLPDYADDAPGCSLCAGDCAGVVAIILGLSR